MRTFMNMRNTRYLNRTMSTKGKKIMFPDKRVIEITTSQNRPGLLEKILRQFHSKDIDLYSINGRVIEKKSNGLEKCIFDIALDNSNAELVREVEEYISIVFKAHTRFLPIPVVDWFPSKESDLDLIGDDLMKPADGLNQDHPGFKDEEYRRRRKLVADATIGYKMKSPIPRIEYTSDEVKLWNQIYTKMRPLHEKFGCKEYIKAMKQLEKEGLFSPDRIPQLEDMNQYLKAKTNWRIKPVNGILSSREFLNCLAFRTFCCTQYIRHTTKPEYTPEPDIMHEFLGHVPNFADPKICDISQKIGILSLGASDSYIELLGAIYWFTIEFGVCREGKDIKFYGAGPGGSWGEILNMDRMMRESPEKFITLDIIDNPPPRKFVIQDVQPFYYVADSFDNFIDQLDEHSRISPTYFQLRYDNITNSYESDRALDFRGKEDEKRGLSF